MARTLSLFEALTRRGRVMRQVDLVQIVVDGSGAMVTPAMDFRIAQKWAQSKPASGNQVTDVGRFFEKLDAIVSRRGSALPTRGSAKQLENIAKLMVQSGYDLDEWMLPPELKDLGKGGMIDPMAGKARKDKSKSDEQGEDNKP